MQPSQYHFRTQQHHVRSQGGGLEEKIIAQTFRKPITASEFNYERNIARRLRSQQSQQSHLRANGMYDFEEEMSLRNIYHEPPSLFLAAQRTVIREFTKLIYRQRESYLTFDEFFVLLSKNKVCADPEVTLLWFRELDQDNDNLINIADLQNILGQDLISLNVSELNEGELVLRFALEIFHHLSDDCAELDLKRCMNFIKFSLREEIDFVPINFNEGKLETIEMFGFVQDLYFGQVRTKVPLQTFLQKVCPQLKKSLSKVVVRKCQQAAQQQQSSSKPQRQGLHARNVNSVEQLLRRPGDTRIDHINTNQNHNQIVKQDLEKLIQQNFHLNLEVEVQDEDQKSVDEQEQIVNYLKENRPKQRGWLQRLSLNKANKWSLLFFQIEPLPKCLKVVKPKGVKKIFDICKIDVEMLKNMGRVHRKSNSLQNNFSQASQALATNSEYLVIREPRQKPYVLRSFDAAELLALITEYRNNQKLQISQNQDEQYTYSGILGIVNTTITDVEQLMKQQFKEFLVVLKEGRLILYDVISKHNLPLEQLSISPQQPNLPFIPSHPFPFQLIQREKSVQQEYLQVNKKRIEKQQLEDGEDVPESVIMWQIDEEEQDDSDHEQKKSKGMFSTLMDKFKSKKEPVEKSTRIILAAESDMKRRQWIFSINYYKSYKGREQQDFQAQKSNKSSYYSSFSHNQTPIPSQYNHHSQQRSAMFRSLHSQTNQIFIGGNHTHINMNVLSIGGEDDYYDIFRDNQHNNNNEQAHDPPRDSHFRTEPNEQQKDGPQQLERLITLPSRQSMNWKSNFINSTTNIELWQRFLINFFKYLRKWADELSIDQNNQYFDPHRRVPAVKQEIDETQEPSVQKLYNRRLNVCKPK